MFVSNLPYPTKSLLAKKRRVFVKEEFAKAHRFFSIRAPRSKDNPRSVAMAKGGVSGESLLAL